jgi:uncharacterized protein YjbI with pentapeptide repeats
MTQCAYDYARYRCREEAVTAEDLCIFHDPSLKKEASRILERLKARLAATAEDEVLRLDGSVFPQGLSFREMVFNCSVWFYRVEFCGGTTDFTGARFYGKSTDFTSARFQGEATYFLDVEFRGETYFTQAEFRGETYFGRAKFGGETTYFNNTEFCGKTTNFSGAQFNRKALFASNLIGHVFNEGAVSFQEINVSQSAELVFDRVNLSKTSFLWVDLRRAEFVDVEWNHAAGRWRGRWRSRLYDEERWLEERRKDTAKADSEYLSQLARIYRALKAYYRQTGEYQLVGHFTTASWRCNGISGNWKTNHLKGRRAASGSGFGSSAKLGSGSHGKPCIVTRPDTARPMPGRP